MIRTTTKGMILQCKVGPQTTVSYDAQFNLVEVVRGKVIRCEIAPAGYTVSEFIRTVQRVREYYEANQN